MKRLAGIIVILLISFSAESWSHGSPYSLEKSPQQDRRTTGIPNRIITQSESTPSRVQDDPVVKTIRISGDQAGNKRFPGVAENDQGDRLVIFRGGDNYYWYSFYKKGSSWSSPAQIPDQPLLELHTCVDVVADSTGRFHCVWEEPDVAVVYGSFLDGQWTAPTKLPLVGRHDMGVSIAVRSNDEVIIANSTVINSHGLTKDIFFWYKGKDDSRFTAENVMEDAPSSTQPSIAVDANDHIWLEYKTEPQVGSEWLDVRMVHYDQNNIWKRKLS